MKNCQEQSELSKVQNLSQETLLKEPDWSYSENPYEDSAASINAVSEAFRLKKDLRFIQDNKSLTPKIVNKAEAIYRYSQDLPFDRNKSGEQMIYDKWPLENEKHIEYDCEDSDSEADEIEFDFPICDDIMAIIDTEKQDGKMYFAAKIIPNKEKQFSIKVQRLKGAGNDKPIVEIIEKRDIYYLFKISMTSQVKKFKIILTLDNKDILESKQYNFSLERIEYDIGLNYDFEQMTKLPMSVFQGVIVASSFNIVDQINFFDRSITKLEERSKSYLNETIILDEFFERFLNGQKNLEKLLIQLQIIVKSPQKQDQKIDFYEREIIQKVSNYFMKFMIKHQLKIDEERKITSNIALKLIETFLEISTFEKITKKSYNLLKGIDEHQMIQKLAVYLQFLIHQKKFQIVYDYFKSEIQHSLNLIHKQKGLDSIISLIQSSIDQFNQFYVDLVVLVISYFIKFTKTNSSQLINVLVKAFGDKNYHWEILDDEQMVKEKINGKITAIFLSEIAGIVSVQNNDDFSKISKLVHTSQSYDYLKPLFCDETLINMIEKYSQSMIKQVQSQKQKSKIQKSIQILNEYCFYDIQKHHQKLKNLSDKILRNPSFDKNSGIKCEIVHKLILNPLLKNYNTNLSSSIKHIQKQLVIVVTKKMDFQQTSQFVYKCFQPSIISNPSSQQLYQKFFLEEIYKQHFVKGNADDFENFKGDYKNWHNFFKYQFFINSFILENVVKLLFEKNKQNRQKELIVKKLKQLIQKGTCSSSQKQNLKYIVETQNISLTQEFLIKIISQEREKLFVLRKLKADKSQQVLLNSLISQLVRKIQNEEKPANIYIKIAKANQNQKKNIETIFSSDRIIKIIQEKNEIINQCFENHSKIRAFIDFLNSKFQLKDYEKLKTTLMDNQKKTREKQLRFKDQLLIFLSKVDEKILKCYTFSSFFQGQTAKNISFQEAIERCRQLMDRFISNRDRVMKQFAENKLTYGSISFFKAELSREKQLRALFSLNFQKDQEKQNNADMIEELLKTFAIIQKIPLFSKITSGLIYYLKFDEREKANIIRNELTQIETYFKSIQAGESQTNISKLSKNYNQLNKIFEGFKYNKTQKLNLSSKKSIELLEFLYEMTKVKPQNLQKIMKIKPQIGNLKQKCDEDQDSFEVDYEDLQRTQTMIDYIQKVFEPYSKEFKKLIQETAKMIATNSRLKISYKIFEKMQKLMKQFNNVNKGDAKMAQKIYGILEKCIVSLKFDQRSNLRIQLIQNVKIEEKMTEEQAKYITEDEIRNLKNYAVLYIIQKNQSVKSQQQLERTGKYKQFLQLLRNIDSIKRVWQQLKHWGYIIFRNSVNSFVLDQKITVISGDNKELKSYVQKYKKICNQWIAEMKSLQTVSKKATLLQGQAVRQFYEVITKQNKQNKINFLNICEITTLEGYINSNKAPIYQKNDPFLAIKAIKQFFEHLLKINKQEIKVIGDEAESYIKISNITNDQDFMKGVLEVNPHRIKNLDITKILICVEDTTETDIKSFIQTAIRDETSEYVIIRPEALSNKKQEYIIKKIQQHRKENQKSSLKLCLVTNSEIQALYQYLKNNFVRKPASQHLKAHEVEYQKFILSKLSHVQIVKSACPGYGKTSLIIQKSKNRKCIFFPLAGAPTSEYIYQRFEEACRQIYKFWQSEKKLCSFIVQIHNIDPGNFQIVNTFLQELITCKGIRYDGQFPLLLRETLIFIEIENIQSINKFDPLETFKFLKLISQIKSQIVNEIKERPALNFKLSDEKKTEYILQHLDYLDNNLLDKNQGDAKNLQPFNQFKFKGIKEARGNELMKKYFFDVVPQATFYQYQYFCSLLFSVCNTFSTSFGLSFICLQSNYDNFYRQKLGLSTMRTQFFKVVLNNCRQFIVRQIDYQQFNYQKQSQTQKKLKQIPFLIIPNNDGQSFSFIYKDHKSVPVPIRNFYISQDTELIQEINKGNLEDIFEKHSIKKLEQSKSKLFDQKIEQILLNIAGSKKYTITQDPNYVVNIDNFFKMCLITLRQRQNIPIIIMGEAGTGKTAILKHVSQQLYQHQFMTLNVNAGTKVEDLRKFLSEVQKKHGQLKDPKMKIWVFFDEFNTLKEVGYMKEIMIDKRFEGKQLPFLKDVVIMAACNPFRKLNSKKKLEEEKQNKEEQSLAFHVLPPPHSMIECMWNFGALSSYEYERYIEKMIKNVEYKTNDTTKLLLRIHEYLANQFDSSVFSLRDIERFRTIYDFFSKKLPLNHHLNTAIYPGYDNRDERALIMSLVFCYTLRIESQKIKQTIYSYIEDGLNLGKGKVVKVKQVQETDFFHRMKIQYGSIAANSAIKENTYCFFVAIYNRLPMIIVGPPGCSKSLAIRILGENMKGFSSQDKYLAEFKAIRAINFQGSQLCTSKQVESLFAKAMKPDRNQCAGHETSIKVIVFDQIGLADKSKQNPLKVIHPYLQVSRSLNLNSRVDQQRNYSFLGISNTDLDISKMSRMIVLRRPQPTDQELKLTAIGIASSFEYGKNEKIINMIKNISEAFFMFVQQWHALKNFRNFYSLRDFYSLIKYFLGCCKQRQISVNDDNQLNNLLEEAVFKNLNGMNNSVEIFMKNYCQVINQGYHEGQILQKFDTIESIVGCLSKQNLRFPLVLASDEQSQSYLINLFINKFQRTTYFEKSPFDGDLKNTEYILQSTAQIIKTVGKGGKLILNNIESTIQTSLYDMLNKFYIIRGDQKYCRISQVESGMTKKTLVHNDFNSIFLLLSKNLTTVEAPFLSRFEKYHFSMSKIPNFKKIENICKQTEIFKKQILAVCKQKGIQHYKIENFFQNCDKDSVETLVLRVFNEYKKLVQKEKQEEQEDQLKVILDEVIYEMVLNSTQDFVILYQYVIKNEIQLSVYTKAIERAIQKKKQFSIEKASEVVIFTTDKSVLLAQTTDKKTIKEVDVRLLKNQKSFEQTLKSFLNSKQEKIILIQLRNKDLESLQYFVSEVQKIKLQQQISNQTKYEDKRFIFFLELNRQTGKDQNDNKIKGISYLSQYRQIFFQGKLEIQSIKNDKKQFFDKILDLSTVLTKVEQFFIVEIKSKNDQLNNTLLRKFKALYNQIRIDKSNPFHRHLEEFIQKTQGTNVTINKELILQTLQDPQILKQSRSFKEALTKKISNQYYYGTVAFFLKYLFQKDCFLSYSRTEIHNFNSVENFVFTQNIRKFITNVKESKMYGSYLTLLTSKKIEYLVNEYQKMKKFKRLPSIDRKFTVSIERGRFIHYSKAQNQMILSKQNNLLFAMAQNIYTKQNGIERQLKVFRQELYSKSGLVIKSNGNNNGENLYNAISKDSMMKELFVFELLTDMVQNQGINIAYIETYMKLFKMFVNFDSSKQNKTLDLEEIIFVILVFKQHLSFVFKLFAVFYSNNIFISPIQSFFQQFRIKQIKEIQPFVCDKFFEFLIKDYLSPILRNYSNIKVFGGAKKFYEIFTNCMLQIQNLQKILKKDNPISPILISIRDISRFLSEFNQELKYELLEQFMKQLDQESKNLNIYSLTYRFVEDLYSKSHSQSEKSLILKFQANKIFLQWFKDQPNDKDCLQNFIKKCEEDSIFCQNSMHVINYLLNFLNIPYNQIQQIEESLKDDTQKQLLEIAKYSKQKGFQNNLSILMVNIFLQKLIKANKGKSHTQIVQQYKRFIIGIYNKLSVNDISSPLYQIFLFSFTKFVLISYSETFITDQIDNDISILLNNDSDLSVNSQLFCLKMLRKHFPPKQIKEKFIKIKRMHWSSKIEQIFKEEQSRSLIVPKDFCDTELSKIFTEIQKSDGSAFSQFEQMLEFSKGFQNRYSILNFFMRFYYTYSYNSNAYKEKTVAHFNSIRNKFEQKLGKIETQLISRYLSNNVSPHFNPKEPNSVNQEDFVTLNFINIFLASKKSISPLHSMFIQNGQLSTDLESLVKQQFALSGPQNPFISNAVNTINLTRNNNIGVYICCSDCDYLYTHEDCGWPRDHTLCPMCGQRIGIKDRSHTLSRDDKGARRIMNKAFVDKSVFYVWNMKDLTEYWQVQRKYIEAEINRMKLKKQFNIKKTNTSIKLTGLNVVDSGRISRFSYKTLSVFIDTISYFLISLNVIKPESCKNIFGDQNCELAMNRLHGSIRQTNDDIKASLNLGNKFYGWMFGIQRNFIQDMNDFPTKFGEYQKSLIDETQKLKASLNTRITEKKIKQDYINLYIEFLKTIDEGYFVKEVCAIKQYTAQNQFTRDYAQRLFEKLVSSHTDQKKFDFSIQYQNLQGKMQFPNDVFLTQDKIDEKKYNYYKIFKLPDQQIGYQEIIVKYEAFIKEKYPFLDYILKQSDLFFQMKNFYNVISFVNKLQKQVNNRYQRAKAEQPLEDFLKELKQQHGNSLSRKLRQPERMIQSWKKLSSFLGVLQNQCKIIGKMNDEYNKKTELKAFLLDQSTKQNPYGLMIASLFHNFAKKHNQSMGLLNSRKNLIKSYSSLNLFNELQKIHPQKIELQQIYTLDEEQLKNSLEQCSIASITYGQNFIYHNFDAYEQHFLKKLEGKCEIISDLKQFISVCYNGEAFSAQNQGSAVLAEIRQILGNKLSPNNLQTVQQLIRRQKENQGFEKFIVQLRGDLQRIMLALSSLKGNFSKQRSLSYIINEIEINVSSDELKNGDLSEIPLNQIVDLYEVLENELMYNVIKRLPEKYKAKFETGTDQMVEGYLSTLPKEQNDQQPTLKQLESAIMKFTSRTLQNGIFDGDKSLIEFVTTRADFWPQGYSDDKIQSLTYSPEMLGIKICNVMALIELIAKVKNQN